MTLVLAIILFLLSAFDAWTTQSRIKRFGVIGELNASIKYLANKIGPELGAILGVMVPATALILVALGLHLQWVLALLVGFRARQFFNQVESIYTQTFFKKELEILRQQILAASSSGQHRSLPVAPLESVEPKTGRTISSEDRDGR